MGKLFDNVRKHIHKRGEPVKEYIESLPEYKTQVWNGFGNPSRAGIVSDVVERNFDKIDNGLSDLQYHIAVPSGAIPGIIRDKRFLNQFDTGTSGGALNGAKRAKLSDKYFGYTGQPVNGDIREKYGFATNKVHKIPLYQVAQGNGYGSYTFDFRPDKVKDRTTVTFGDSLDNFDYNTPDASHGAIIPGDRESYWSYFRPNVDGDQFDTPSEEDLKRLAIHANELGEINTYGVQPYLETQYHGPLTLDDASAVYVDRNTPSYMMPLFERMSDEYKMPLYDIGGCYRNCDDFDPLEHLLNYDNIER